MEKPEAIIEAILFAVGRPVSKKELITALELSEQEIELLIQNMQEEYKERGIDIIKIEETYQLSTRKKYYDYIYPILDHRVKPSISTAAMETLAIIAYNPKITRAEIEAIRGVNSDGTVYKLLEYNLIENAGKSDAPGRPTTYRTTKDFLKLFGMSSLDELPELPRYKIDENEQIVIDDILPTDNENDNETPCPEREE